MMLQYTSKKNKSSSYFSLLLLICGIVLFASSNFIKIAPYITQIIAIVFVVFAIQVMQRYVLPDFIYIIDDKDSGESLMSVIRVHGSKKITVCSIDLSKCLYAGDSDKNTLTVKNSFDYRQNFFSNDKFILIYHESGDNIQIKLEADDKFKNALISRVPKH